MRPSFKLEKIIGIADDVPIFLEFVGGILTKHGYRVETFLDPYNLIASVNKDPNSYGLIMLDQRYQPLTETGIDFTKKIHENETLKEIPIVLMDASNLCDVHNLFLEAGGIAVLNKPISDSTLIAVVERFYNTRIIKN